MIDWTKTPEAAALLRSCASDPPRRRIYVYCFQETESRYVGDRVRRLRRLYRSAEPPIDTAPWRAWLAADPQSVIARAVRGRVWAAAAPTAAQATRSPVIVA